MVNTRSQIIAIAPALLVFSLFLAPTLAPADETSPDERNQAFSNAYFLQRSAEFEQRMALHEQFLTWLYQSINTEVSQRRREDWLSALDAISPPELAGVSDSAYIFPPELDDAPLRVKYVAWEKLQRDEFNHKFYEARVIKRRLRDRGSPVQRLRMFRWDLQSALYSFRDGYYRDAVLQFTEAIDFYGYSNVADLRFYRAESFFALSMLEQAEEDFKAVVAAADPDFTRRSLERLILISGDKGDLEALNDWWSQYDASWGGNSDKTYWRTLNMTARYYFAMQQWDRAAELFGMIPDDSPFHGEAILRQADCLLAQLKLDAAEELYFTIITPPNKKARKKLKPYLREAGLKVGYINFLRGEFEASVYNLSQIEGDDEVAEKAGIVELWAWFRLSAYGKVLQLARQFVERFPQTQYYYELHCLMGFCSEVSGEDLQAIEDYKVVMEAMDHRQDYHDLNYEGKAVDEAMAKLMQVEPLLFVEGRNELFGRYLDLQRKLVTLKQNIELSEAAKTNPVMLEVLGEQREVSRLLRESSQLTDTIRATGEVKLAGKRDELEARLLDLADEISSGVKYYEQQKSLVQREEEQQFKGMLGDSVSTRMIQEWDETRQALQNLETVRARVEESGDPDLMFALAGVESDLLSIQNRIMGVRGRLGELATGGVNSNIDWWSWFAYHRSCTDCQDFDDYYARRQRLDELDNYITRINEILNEREEERQVEEGLPENLVPASEPGEPEYSAPPAPMWKPVAAVMEEPTPEDTLKTAPEDTSQAEPPLLEKPVGETPVEGEGGESEVVPQESGEAVPAEAQPGADDGKAPPEEVQPEPESGVPTGEAQPGEDGGTVEQPQEEDATQPAVEETKPAQPPQEGLNEQEEGSSQGDGNPPEETSPGEPEPSNEANQ